MPDAPPRTWEPPRPMLVALALTGVFVAILCAPMLAGKFLAGPHSDQFIAGYGFRQFWTEYVRAHGSVPLWNPYIFGGLPYVGAMHGDLLYPFTWIRLLVATDTAMNLAFFVHLWLAGFLTVVFLRALGLPWAAALFGGVAYQLSGQVASLVHPGHDGKLYVSALLPLVLWALVRWIRDGKAPAAGVLGLAVGCAILSPSFQMAYYLLLAAGMFALHLAFLDPERPADRSVAWRRLGVAAAMVALGAGVAAIQILPFLDYLPFSPRSVPGSSSGWEYATAYSLPPEELLSSVLPQLWGHVETYYGRNPLKLHSEYLGVVPLMLATIGLLATERRRLRWTFMGLAGAFLLISLGGYTPFYRLVYELLPMMKKVRAPSMAFYLPTFAVAVWGALGVERLWRAPRDRPPGVAGWLVALAVLLLLALAGVLTNFSRPLAESAGRMLGDPNRAATAAANQTALVLGALRLVAFAVLLAGVLYGWRAGKIGMAAFALALPGLAGLDLTSWIRHFFVFSPPAAHAFAADEVTLRIQSAPKPYRVFDAGGYGWAVLMGYDIPQVTGYHGNEIRYYDDLLGGKNAWRYLYSSPQLWRLLAVRFVITADTASIPGYHHVLGPVTTAQGRTAHLYEADSLPPYAQVATAAIKAPADAITPTLIDPRLPGFDRVVLYDESQPIAPPTLTGMPSPSPVHATVTAWEPGRMAVELDNALAQPSYLLVSENWYPGWEARVNGQGVTPLRGDQSLLTVPLPPGAQHVELTFHSTAYRRGRLISWLSTLALVAIIGVPRLVRRRRA